MDNLKLSSIGKTIMKEQAFGDNKNVEKSLSAILKKLEDINVSLNPSEIKTEITNFVLNMKQLIYNEQYINTIPNKDKIETLIKNTKRDPADISKKDAENYYTILALLIRQHWSAAKQNYQTMDTAPREEFWIAMTNDGRDKEGKKFFNKYLQ